MVVALKKIRMAQLHFLIMFIMTTLKLGFAWRSVSNWGVFRTNQVLKHIFQNHVDTRRGGALYPHTLLMQNVNYYQGKEHKKSFI